MQREIVSILSMRACFCMSVHVRTCPCMFLHVRTCLNMFASVAFAFASLLRQSSFSFVQPLRDLSVQNTIKREK